MEDKSYCPIVFCPPGTCPECYGKNLMLVERNIDVSFINYAGVMEESTNLEHESKLYCPDCNTDFDYEKHGYFIMPVTELGKELQEVTKKINTSINAKNPFSM